jgi:hypothetical protein
MSTLTPEQRGDLAEQMLPVAAHLAVLVHGDGGPEDVAEALAGLDDTAKNALIVVLAGLVDPEQPVGKALGWLDFNEHGSLTVPSWSEHRSVRDLAPEPADEPDDDYIDEVAVKQYLRGVNDEVTPRERLEAIALGVRTGMTYPEFDAMYGLRKGSTATFVSRQRKYLAARGVPVPSMERPDVRVFSEEEVVAIREKSANGASDIELALSFSSDPRTIGHICRGVRYAKYGGPIREARTAKSLQASREYMCGHAETSRQGLPAFVTDQVLTPNERDAIRQRTAAGEPVKALAAEYQVSTDTIRNHAA